MFALHPTHIGGGQLAGEQGVLRQIFKIASAQRHPFMVHGGAQQNVYAQCLGLTSDGCCRLLHQLLVPARADCRAAGQACRRIRIVLVEAVRRRRSRILMPHPEGSIAHFQGTDPLCLHGFPIVGANRQAGHLFQLLFRPWCTVHSISPQPVYIHNSLIIRDYYSTYILPYKLKY